MKSLPPDIEQLLEAERNAPEAPAEAKKRVHRKIEITVGLAVAGVAGKAAAASKTALLGKSLAAKLILGAVSASLVGGGVYLATQKKTPIFAAAPAAPGETVRGASWHAPTPMVTVPSLPPPAPPPKHHPAALTLEQALLEEARAALAAGAPGRALMLLQQHERQFPAAQLGEARESLRISALVADGRRDLAGARAAEFRRRYPHSLFQPAVDASLSH